MGKMQRQKGAEFERAVATLFASALRRKVQRHLGQARDGGSDIETDEYVIECKRRKSLNTLYKWMRQVQDATPYGKTPLVVMRADNTEALVALRLEDFLTLVEARHDGLA